MAEIQTETPPSDPAQSSLLFNRKIEFLPIRKPFHGFSNNFQLETLNPSSSKSTRTPSSAPNKHHSEYSEFGFDPELSFGITFRRIGAGLQNLGNTCFLNSVLQCLTYTEPLAAYLQSGKHKTSCRVAGFCALCAIQNHVSRALQANGKILSPQDLVGNLRRISRNFRNARQEDAHEYMVNLLESMHKCCLPSGLPSESPGAYDKSLVHKIFGGRLRSQVKCQECSSSSNKFEPFLDLSLEIFRADSVQKALVNFTAKEWLDGGEREYNCQRCKQKVRALKQLTIHKAPYVLTIHLKRFHAHDPGQKIKKKIQFGCALDLKPFVSGSYDGDLKYSLYGVLVHSGSSTHSGHYFCYVRTSNNMWYTLDDNRVNHVSEREVLNQQAYMLFYVRDRKSIVPRKPVDIAKKENINTIVNGIRDSSTSNHVLKEYPNGLVEPTLSAKTMKNMSNADLLGVSVSKDTLVEQKYSLVLAESMKQDNKPASELSSCAQIMKDSPQSLSSIDHSEKDKYVHTDLTCMAAPVGDKTNMCNESEISKEGTKDSIVPDFISQSPEKIVGTKDINIAQDPSTNLSISTSPITSSDVNWQAGTSAPGSAPTNAGCIVCENAVGSQGLILNESECRSLNMERLKQKHVKKSKKKFLKYQVSSMQLRPIFLYMTYTGQKKNHKRCKRRKLSLRNLNKEKLDKHSLSSDVGLSSSDVSPCVSSCFESKATKAGYRSGANLKFNDPCPMRSNTKGDMRRVDAVLATSMEVEDLSGRGERDQMHNSLMSMLTRGLEETVVARWDDIEIASSRALETKSSEKVKDIGYVGDEWDEELDKGKRKKLRTFKHNFDGPNIFQEIATEKFKSKRAKLEGNPPFRI
ncbi:ubiquitin carboxyl-terminal hydrolase 23-like isoform X2 [Lotus japonicus]|uniref:ubiquitin carboxyl-terminal hydrolase 23-like isoform X2 n=1 Tax=Lotus japonicus TaxID=34305 RepID=UPI00258B36F7|nr:ubiquitin carboxyl-terminal hydrolase 23-like isoform X2 [Lotus japonicus]